jgi:hypothetical protein
MNGRQHRGAIPLIAELDEAERLNLTADFIRAQVDPGAPVGVDMTPAGQAQLEEMTADMVAESGPYVPDLGKLLFPVVMGVGAGWVLREVL